MAYGDRVAISQPIRYMSAGLLTASAEYFSFILLLVFIDVSLLVHALSFILAFHVSFLLNRLWVFESDSSYTIKPMQQYAAVALLAAVNLVFSSVIFVALGTLLPAVIAKMGSMGLTALWTYIIMKRKIFTTVRV